MSRKRKKYPGSIIEKHKSDRQQHLLKSPIAKTEINFKTISATGFLISLLLLIFCYHFFGSFFEMNDDPRYVMAMKGYASPAPYNNFVSVYKLTSDLYIYLYKQFPHIGWYGLSMFLLLWGALFNIYITLYLVFRNGVRYLLVLLMFLSFYFLVFIQNVYLINFTRPSILVTSSFIILLAVLYRDSETLQKNKWILVFPVFTYVFGHLTRLDAGYLGFVFGLGFALLFLYRQKKLFPFLLKFIAPVVIFILIVKTANYFQQKNKTRNKDFIEKTELIRQLIDYRNAAAYSPKDIKDTVSYHAMINFRYCSDDKIISVDFLKKLTSETSLLQGGNKKKFVEEFGTFLKSLTKENFLAAIINSSIVVLVILGFFFSPRKNYLEILKYLLFQLLFLSIIAGMSYYMKLPARIFHPLLVILTFGNLVFAGTVSYVSTINLKSKYLLLLPCLLSAIGIPRYLTSNNTLLTLYKRLGEVNRIMIDDMNSRFSNTIFIPTNVRSWEMHNATDPVNEINFENGNSYVYLTIELSLAPETKDQLIDKFGTDDHSKLFKKISKMNNVVFISNNNFNAFLSAYYFHIYGQKYYFEPVDPNPPLFFQPTKLNYYRLKPFAND